MRMRRPCTSAPSLCSIRKRGKGKACHAVAARLRDEKAGWAKADQSNFAAFVVIKIPQGSRWLPRFVIVPPGSAFVTKLSQRPPASKLSERISRVLTRQKRRISEFFLKKVLTS